MKICIIGSSGYIGSVLSADLSQKYEVDGYDPRPCNVKGNNKHHLMTGNGITGEDLRKYNIVIYLGGLSGRVSCANNDWDTVYHENVEDLSSVLSKLNKDQLVIYASSASILEGSKNVPVDESYTPDETLMDSYAKSMTVREIKVAEYMNTNTIGLRFGTVIGISPSQRYDLIYLAMMISAEMKNQVTVCDPTCGRSILYIHDLIKAINNIIDRYADVKGHRVYNLASFNATIGDIANHVSKFYEVDLVEVKRSNVKETPLGFSQDISAFKRDFGFEPIGTPEITMLHLKAHMDELLIGYNSKYVDTEPCRVCKSSTMMKVVDIGPQPLANNYVNEPMNQEKFPLVLVRCKECNHTQLSYTVSPEKMFSNYLYNSGTSKTLREYFEFLALKVVADVGKTDGVVLELACNDGTQLNEFLKLGWKTFGVDPAVNIGEIARSQGHTIFTSFWGTDVIHGLPKDLDAIVAQNVLAHVPDPTMFLQACYNTMNDDTLLYIQTSQCDMLRNAEFDTVYHEHLSYFTVSSLIKIASLVGLDIIELIKTPIHGTSFLCKMRKSKSVNQGQPIQIDDTCKKLLDEEIALGLHTDTFYINYMKRVNKFKNDLIEIVKKKCEQGYKIIGYGAAAKGMTMMNFFDLSAIEYIVDDAKMKHYRFTPGTNLPIYPPEYVSREEGKLCIIIFAWNFLNEIKLKIKELTKNEETILISPFPSLVVESLL